MAHDSIIVENITLIKKGPGIFNIPELPSIPSSRLITEHFSSFRWRGVRAMQQSIVARYHKSPDSIRLQTFRPDIISSGLHHCFYWLHYALGKNRVVLHIGDIEECDFTNGDPRREVLLPNGWTNGVLEQIGMDIVGYDDDNRAILSSGETGIVVDHTIAPMNYLG